MLDDDIALLFPYALIDLAQDLRLSGRLVGLSVPGMDVPGSLLKRLEGAGKGKVAEEGIKIALNVKKPGPGEFELDRAVMTFDYEQTFHAPLVEAYEALLLEAMEGDHTLFTREDEVERGWEVLMPVLEHSPPVAFYEKGSWGPREADEMILPHHWHMSKLRDDD